MLVKAVPLTLAQANAHVAAFHRHHKPTIGHRFSIGVMHQGYLVGVAICGRPVARKTDQDLIIEVLRLCTDGTKNACSFLYGACARIAKEMGFTLIQTFILKDEPGTSLEAAGWELLGTSPGRSWSVPSRHRESESLGPKKKYGRKFLT